jgi:hypothetical protein
MNWNQNKSITLSQLCIVLFALLLGALDVGGYWLTGWFVRFSQPLAPGRDQVMLLIVLYLCSILGWVLLYALWRLLGRLRVGDVFSSGNVRLLRMTSWCCLGACGICLVGGVVCYPLLGLIAIAAGFVGLIVRIVKNVFEQAIAMKDELDFTI